MAQTVSSISKKVDRKDRPDPIRLKMMSARELIELFHELRAPDLSKMHGEFAATLLDQGSVLGNLVGTLGVNAPGRWLCKAFEPLTDDEGHGYNSFQRRTRIIRRLRMKTYVGESKIDDGESYFLQYSAYNRGLMATMVDELRTVSDELFLGIGRVGLTQKQRSRLLPFMLEGPIAPFARD